MSSKTVRETGNATVREGQAGNATVREEQASSNIGSVSTGSSFRDYSILRQLPSTSTEADIFVVEKSGTEYILKLYRFGIEPKNDILQSIKSLSEKYPHNFIRVFEADFDAASKRWFEIQEYAKFGTLQAVIDNKSQLDSSQQKNLFNDVARQVGESLNLLHQNNLLHLDVKPSNILLRSLKPLDMVLIDFGIATSLASDMSKKFTQTRGTPMYQSPESYTGGMGRASDWWGLGMILLEIASGSHPFKGLSPNVIAYSVATEPVNIPDKLDKGQIELFHGLLTRDPAKRWEWDQVSRWLKGERGIPQYFEEASAAQNSQTLNIKPFAFMGNKCTSLAEIAAAFVQSEEAWEKGKALLMRGNIRTWLEQNGEFEQGEDIERGLAKIYGSDEKMFYFTQQHGENIPLILCGKAITLQNLLLFAGKAVRKEKLTAGEQKIVDMMQLRRIQELAKNYNDKHHDDNSKLVMLAFNNFSNSMELSEIAALLDFYLNPKKYFCPFVKNASSLEDVIKSSKDLNRPPRRLQEFTNIDEKYIVPKSLLDGMKSAGTYQSSFKELEKMQRENHLISRSTVSGLDKSAKDRLASVSMDGYLAEMYKLQWGYDDKSAETIKNSLTSFRREANSASGFQKAQFNLWIAYLEFLNRKTMPLADDDKKLLNDVSLNKTDDVERRLQELVR